MTRRCRLPLSTPSVPSSPAARSPSPRPAPSLSMPERLKADACSPCCRIFTCASCRNRRSSATSPRPSRRSTRDPHSRSSAVLRRRATSNSAALRACTDLGRSSSLSPTNPDLCYGRFRVKVNVPNRLASTDPALVAALDECVPGGVRWRPSQRLAMAHDASHYLLVPGAVVTPERTEQIAALVSASARQGVALTFRSGGTSLSGQAVTNGVLVDTRRNFRRIEVLDSGLRVRVQPGATVSQVNARLARYGRKLGPDPASESACTVGGVVANNSSGMACGTEFNTYRTMDSAVIVLASGTVIDTAAPDADARLRSTERELYEGLLGLRDRVRANAKSRRTIEQQFSLKNTMGYGINSFLGHTTPLDILAHLIIGSEGTLAFIAEVTFRTIPVRTHAATGLLVFNSLRAATDALPELVAAGLATIELLDATSLIVAQTDPTADAVLPRIAVDGHAALLVEVQESEAEELMTSMAATALVFARLPLVCPAGLSTDPVTRSGLWHIRKGLYAAVAGARP